jgi:plasmid stabilization system protein ParE
MATVRITKQAWSDLEAVLEYYDQSAPGFAEVFEEEVVEKIRRLRQFPRMG